MKYFRTSFNRCIKINGHLKVGQTCIKSFAFVKLHFCGYSTWINRSGKVHYERDTKFTSADQLPF
jgi:hypothetical protein